MFAPKAYEPRVTFSSYNNDYLSKTGYGGAAVHTVHY